MSFASVPVLMAGTSNGSEQAGTFAGRPGSEDLLVALLTDDVPTVRDLLRVAASMARTTDATLHVVSPLTDSEPITRSDGTDLSATDEQALVEWGIDAVSGRPTGTGVETTWNLVNGILACVRTNDIDTVVLPSGSVAGRVKHGLTERLAIRASCDVVTFNGQSGYEEVPSILLAVSGGPHSGLASDVAGRIARDCDAWIDVLHVLGDDAPEHRERQANECVDRAVERIDRPDSTETWLLRADDPAEAIIEQSGYYGLTVIGAPTSGRLRQFIFGSTNRTIRSRADSVVISARRRTE